ncbi:hypothetical protein GALL_386640 [mine drainage metagenome]|uniref:Uncharacterized protein n=1 Tax=mine drainage metagenome TaxID=410659 RepID=A0A1J5QHW5_9ZZZZ
MSYFADALPFEPGTRMTNVWRMKRENDTFDDHVVTVHLIILGEDQDGDLEGTFLTRFLPFHTGGFSGVDPRGRPWLVVVQHGSIDESSLLVEGEDPYWALRNAMERAVAYNPEARVWVELCLIRKDLLGAYREDLQAASKAKGWLTSELIWGLLAEMCGVSLHDVAAGYAKGGRLS